MTRSTKIRSTRPRVADEIMSGMRELQKMMAGNRRPEELFTMRTVEVPEPRTHSARQISQLRASLGVSQAVFARLLGVSVVLVKSWENGTREPSPMARRLLDTIKANPSQWLVTIHKPAA